MGLVGGHRQRRGRGPIVPKGRCSRAGRGLAAAQSPGEGPWGEGVSGPGRRREPRGTARRTSPPSRVCGFPGAGPPALRPSLTPTIRAAPANASVSSLASRRASSPDPKQSQTHLSIPLPLIRMLKSSESRGRPRELSPQVNSPLPQNSVPGHHPLKVFCKFP